MSDRARSDLLRQVDWLASLSPRVARNAQRKINKGLRTLARFPVAGVELETGDREWPIPFGRDGYVVVYRIEPERVLIARIFHSRQDR